MTFEHAKRALAAFEASDLGTALRELSQLWQETRAPEVADALELVAKKVAPPRGKPGRTAADRDEAWRKLDASDRLAALDVLLDTLLDVPTKWVRARIFTMRREWPHDPRTAMALTRMMESTYTRGSATYKLWREICELIANIADPRTLPLLEKLDAAQRGTQPVAVTAALNRTNLFARTAHLVRRHLESYARTPTREEAAAIAKIREAFAAERETSATRERTAEDFLRDVWENPNDDGLRQVFADWLLEHGDPRGELINLQLSQDRTPAARRREAELLRAHGREWLGPLDAVVLKDGLVYERGFPARVRTRCKSVRLARDLESRPEWSTIREVDLAAWTPAHRITMATAPVMRSLEVVRGVEPAIVRVTRELPWRELTLLGGERHDAEIVASLPEIAGCARFPRLEVLRFDATTLMPEPARILWSGAITRNVREFGLTLHEGYSASTPRTAIDKWLREMASTATRLERFSVWWDVPAGWRLTLEHDGGAALTKLLAVYEWPYGSSPLERNPQPPLEWLADTISAVPLTAAEVRAKKHVGTGRHIAAFRSALEARKVALRLDVPDPDARAMESA